MPKASKSGYYAVRRGRVPGIYRSWADCEAQIKGFTGAVYKKLSTEAQANEFMAAKSAARGTAPVASASRPPHPMVAVWAVDGASSPAEDEKDCDIVFCDGACRGNGQPGSVAGIGVWWGHGDPRNIAERCPGDQTNNRAELIAIVRILETTPPLERRLLIKTDSHYSIQCVTLWIFKWMRNGFLAADGKPVKNRALIKYLAALLHVRRKSSQTVEFKHVRGHVGIEGNEAADQLANLGATMQMVPERDWEKLEEQALCSLSPVRVVDDELKAYADGLLNDDEFTELAGIANTTPLHPGNEGTSTRRPSPPRINSPGSDGSPVRSSSQLVRSSGSTSVAVPSLQSALHKKRVISISEEELEVYSLCLLDGDELANLGKRGTFDSDF